MTFEEIRTAIKADPELIALAQASDTEAIAEKLSQGRIKHLPAMISARGLAVHLGPFVSETILLKLETARDTLLQSSDPQQKLIGSILRRHLKFLDSDGLDFGEKALLDMFDIFVTMGILETSEVVALKTISQASDPISEFDIRCAIFDSNGSLLI